MAKAVRLDINKMLEEFAHELDADLVDSIL
jgi:hypothetical protein